MVGAPGVQPDLLEEDVGGRSEEHLAFSRPLARFAEDLAVEAFALSAAFGGSTSETQVVTDRLVQDRVAGVGDDVVEAGLAIEVVEDLEEDEAAVKTAQDRCPGEGPVETVDETAQHTEYGDLTAGVAVGVAAGQSVDPLSQKGVQVLAELAGLAPVLETGGQAIQEAQPPVRSTTPPSELVWDRSKQATRGFWKRSWKRTVCAAVPDSKNGPPFVAKTALLPIFHHGEAFFLHPFVNNPG